MIETLFHRGGDGSSQIGIVVIGNAPPDVVATGHVCACYYVRFRVRIAGGITQIYHLHVPHVPDGALFPTLDTVAGELRRAAAVLRAEHYFDTEAPIEILDFALVTLARPGETDAIRVVPSLDEARWPGVTWTLNHNTNTETNTMGFINGNDTGLQYANVHNGALWYRKPGSDEQQKCAGFVGIIRGLRLRERTYEGHTYAVFDMLMKDGADGGTPDVIITGTVLNPEGRPTVFGCMLAERLAHEDLRSRKGMPVKFSVWQSKKNERVSCCTFRDAATDAILGRIELKHLPAEGSGPMVRKLLDEAVVHFGSFGYGTVPASTAGGPDAQGLDAAVVSDAGAQEVASAEQLPFEEDDGLPF
ncbi:MAG TPA: hypothetical protein VHI13_05340 [Candidatus Kapabacteria bacterium]|nr:hypothetical protein [Candidatus Kapabacteria bacterium]